MRRQAKIKLIFSYSSNENEEKVRNVLVAEAVSTKVVGWNNEKKSDVFVFEFCGNFFLPFR